MDVHASKPGPTIISGSTLRAVDDEAVYELLKPSAEIQFEDDEEAKKSGDAEKKQSPESSHGNKQSPRFDGQLTSHEFTSVFKEIIPEIR